MGQKNTIRWGPTEGHDLTFLIVRGKPGLGLGFVQQFLTVVFLQEGNPGNVAGEFHGNDAGGEVVRMGSGAIGVADLELIGADATGSGLTRGGGMADTVDGPHVGDIETNAIAPRFPWFRLPHRAAKDVVIPDKLRHEGRGGLGINFHTAPHLIHPPMIHHHDHIREGKGLILGMGDLNKRHTKLFLEAAQFAAGFDPEGFVKGAQGFVQEQHLGTVGEGTGEGNPLLLTTAELGGFAVGEGFHAHEGEHFFNDGSAIALRYAPHFQAKSHIIPNRFMGKKRVVLKHHGGISLGGRLFRYSLSANENITGCNRFMTRQHSEGGGFSATTGAEETTI